MLPFLLQPASGFAGLVFSLLAGPPAPLLEARVQTVAEEIAPFGFAVDVSSLSVESLDGPTCRRDLDRQQDLWFGRDHFEEMRFFDRACGVATTDSASRHREAVIGSLAAALAAYYQPGRRAIVLGRGATDELLAHELTHAVQDRKRGLGSVLAGGERSIERVRIAQCLLEGEAELVAAALTEARAGKTLADLAADALDDPLQDVVAGTASLPYSYGRRFALARHHEGGWAAVEACLDRLPASTEQILHPEKLGLDSPVTVLVPRARELAGGLALTHEDSIGELGIECLLQGIGASATEARVAATGWDGDRVGIYRDPTGDVVVVWRSVWDRPEDAAQFASALGGRFEGTVARDRNVVDATWSTSAPLATSAIAAMRRSVPRVESDPRDAASTAKIEAAWLARASAIDGKTWVVREHGLSMPVPHGWHEREVRGATFLAGTAADGFEDNVNVVAIPDATNGDLDAIVGELRTALAGASGLALDAISKRRLGAADAVCLEYHGRMRPDSPELHFLAAILPRDGRQIVVTATVAAERWPALQPVLESTLAAARFDPR
jgi:hypothetical protein